MSKARVYYLATASFSVEVEVPEDDFDESGENEDGLTREDVARELADQIVDFPTLCYHCSHRLDLSDYEPDGSDNGVEWDS